MGENKGSKIYLIAAIVSIALIIILMFGYLLPAFQFQNIPAPKVSSPTPIANAILSPNNQIVVVSLEGPSFYTYFSVTITQNGNTLKFPCSIALVPDFSLSLMSPSTRLVDSFGYAQGSPIISNYGTYKIAYGYLPDNMLGTSHYYAILQDSTGAKITSNTVAVDYK